MLPDVMNYVAGGLLVTTLISGASGWVKSNEIDGYKKDIKVLEAQAVVCKTQKEALINAVDIQNAKINEMKVDLNESIERWNNRESSTVYVDRWRTRYIDSNETGDDCEEIKLILDAIRTNGF